jgi:hypothetical protein
MRKLVLIAALLASAPLVPTSAGLPVTKSMTCPIGGGTFDYTTSASYTTFGTRPDGKPYGSWTFPMALPECPANGLVLYKDYTPEEVAKLEPLVASEAYQALRQADTQYYRAYWLMKEMGLGPEAHLWALLQASWEADGKPELRARYQTELVEASAKVPLEPTSLNWVGMEARAVNALRELGRFDEALARLDKVPTAPLDVTIPQGTSESAPVREAKQRRAWLTYLKELRAVIERKDVSPEPLDLIPSNVALGRCIDEAATLGEHQRAFCEKETVKVEAMRASRTASQAELDALRRPREEAGR